jgi:hypothetical protein
VSDGHRNLDCDHRRFRISTLTTRDNPPPHRIEILFVANDNVHSPPMFV